MRPMRPSSWRPGLVMAWVLLLVVSHRHAQAAFSNTLSAGSAGSLIRAWPDGTCPLFPHAKTDSDLSLLWQASLEPDFAQFRGQVLKLSAIAELVGQLIGQHEASALAVVHNGTLHVHSLAPPTLPVNNFTRVRERRFEQVVNTYGSHWVGHDKLPDCVFVFNPWDSPKCAAMPEAGELNCSAPVFSIFKQWDYASATGRQRDILVPIFNHDYARTVMYPWELKTHKALMRAGLYNSMAFNCTRLALYNMSRSGAADAARLLDVGITQSLKRGMRVELAPRVPMDEHALWKYQLSADGTTGQCRLAKLLGINSVVLKEVSPWIEYYNRALQPGLHYVPFTARGVLKVLKKLEATPDAKLQAMVKAAQTFQSMHLSSFAKALYVRGVLRKYVELFNNGAQARFVSSLDPARLQDTRYIVQQLQDSAGFESAATSTTVEGLASYAT